MPSLYINSCHILTTRELLIFKYLRFDQLLKQHIILHYHNIYILIVIRAVITQTGMSWSREQSQQM